MAVGQIFKYFIKVGKQYFGTNSKKVAEELAKGGKRVPKNKVPEGVTVKKAPTIPNPRTSKGTYTRPQPPAARPKTTAPARPKAPAKAPSKPKTETTAPARPKPKTKAPAKPATPSTGSRSTGGRGKGRGKPPLMPKSMVRERPNLPPKPKGSAPALLRDSVRPEAPEISTVPPKKEDTKKGTPSKRLDKKGETPKTPPKKKPTVRPKLRPATGPVTNESFGKAFARNRKAGNATFTWKGNKYTTRYKEESITQHKKKFGVEGKY